MKLARNTEWAIIAALIAYIAFTPGFRIVKDTLATPLGKAAALAAIVYIWKSVSPIVAILLTISFLRCAKWNVWEMFSGAEQACTCEMPGATWDPESKTCKDSTGQPAGPVKSCTCTNGYAWDGGEKGKKECVPVTTEQPPVPTGPVPMPANPAADPVEDALAAGTSMGAAAPAVAGPAAPSMPPVTTPGAAAEMAAMPAVPVTTEMFYGGVQPGAGAVSGPARA
jgi:hypothetical protein